MILSIFYQSTRRMDFNITITSTMETTEPAGSATEETL